LGRPRTSFAIRPASRARWGGRVITPTTKEADVALQAAALAHGIAESQAFIDGNKRLALVSMLTLLEVNGYEVNATDPELADWIIGLSAGTTPEELADLIRSRLKAVE